MYKKYMIIMTSLFLVCQSSGMKIEDIIKKRTYRVLNSKSGYNTGAFKFINDKKKKFEEKEDSGVFKRVNSSDSEKRKITKKCVLKLNDLKQKILKLSVSSFYKDNLLEIPLKKASMLDLSQSSVPFYKLTCEGSNKGRFSKKKEVVDLLVEDIKDLYVDNYQKKEESTFLGIFSFFKKKKSLKRVYKKSYYPNRITKDKDETFNTFAEKALEKFDAIIKLYEE